jgi:membrane-bound inhibitor of C-type lysozyme
MMTRKTRQPTVVFGMLALVITLIAACSGSNPAPAIGTPYQCDGDKSFVAEFNGEGPDGDVKLTMEGETLEMSLVPAASGAKYSDGTTTLWTKGDEAFIEVGDEIVYENCQAPSN